MYLERIHGVAFLRPVTKYIHENGTVLRHVYNNKYSHQIWNTYKLSVRSQLFKTERRARRVGARAAAGGSEFHVAAAL